VGGHLSGDPPFPDILNVPHGQVTTLRSSGSSWLAHSPLIPLSRHTRKAEGWPHFARKA